MCNLSELNRLKRLIQMLQRKVRSPVWASLLPICSMKTEDLLEAHLLTFLLQNVLLLSSFLTRGAFLRKLKLSCPP